MGNSNAMRNKYMPFFLNVQNERAALTLQLDLIDLNGTRPLTDNESETKIYRVIVRYPTRLPRGLTGQSSVLRPLPSVCVLIRHWYLRSSVTTPRHDITPRARRTVTPSQIRTKDTVADESHSNCREL